MSLPSQRQQLSALAQTHELFARSGIEYWLFGGWAVDFHVGSITRPHDDIDVAVWLDDHDRIARLLGAEGWKHAPDPDEDGGTGYERDAVRLELTFLVLGDGGEVYIPLRAGRAPWLDGALSTDIAELSGVRARVVGGGAPARHAAAYLSGLLIGVEWADVRRRNGGRLPDEVFAIGTPALAQRHADAARCVGTTLTALDAREAYLAAMQTLRAAL